MGFLDKLKGTANMAKEKAAEAIDQHGPQIKDGIGKAGDLVDKKTKGKYSDKIAKGTSKANEALDKQSKSSPDETATPPVTPVTPESPSATSQPPQTGTTYTSPTESDPTL